MAGRPVKKKRGQGGKGAMMLIGKSNLSGKNNDIAATENMLKGVKSFSTILEPLNP